MKQAASLTNFAPDTTLPGIKLNTTQTDYAPVKQLQMQRLKGETFEIIGDLIGVDPKTD
jgi:branched-chain amino acid transport system substrate-binding protein